MRQIIKFIDDYLEKNSLEWISAVDANRLLDEQGLLGDSSTRKGLPLRNKLRSGEIPHAYQVGVFWRIPSSRTSSKTAKPTTPSQKKSRVTSTVAPCIVHTNSSLEEELTRLTRFKEAMNVSGHDVPDQPGLYCIRLKKSNDLPAAFSQHIGEITNAIVYIGIASRSLRTRFYRQELHALGHGTFFRSLGAALGYIPPKGSLRDKTNKNNYKFSSSDQREIIKWIEDHLIINWVQCDVGGLKGIEEGLIKKYKPVFNIGHNPSALALLVEMRNECKRVACS